MLFVNPRVVRFGDRVWSDAALVAIDRAAERLIEAWSDHGPYCTLADVAEERVTVRVVQAVAGDNPGALPLGEQAELSFVTSPAASDQGALEVRADCVIVGVSHELSVKHGATRTITLRAVSPDGSTDPVSIVEASAETGGGSGPGGGTVGGGVGGGLG